MALQKCASLAYGAAQHTLLCAAPSLPACRAPCALCVVCAAALPARRRAAPAAQHATSKPKAAEQGGKGRPICVSGPPPKSNSFHRGV